MDMNKMLQQVQQMQEEMAKAQDELAKEVVEASVGGGMVKVKASGAGEIVEITISPEVIDPNDPEGLADLVLAGVNQALKNSQDLMQSKLGGLVGGLEGLGLPGLTFRTSATMGSGAIDPNTRAYLTQNTEFDFDTEYRFDAIDRPDWLKPLSLRGRAGLVQGNLNGSSTGAREFRVILNYEITFRGDGKR